MVLGTLGGVFLGAILLVAVWGKAIAPTAFIGEIESRGLGLLIGPAAVAYLALALEAGLGVLLVLGVRRLWVLVPAALLVAFFLVLTGQDYARSLAGLEAHGAACGCFGNLVTRTPAQAFWQDLALMVPALVLAFFGRPRPVEPAGRAALAPCRRCARPSPSWRLSPRWCWPGRRRALPLDDLATRLKPGVDVTDVCAGEGSRARLPGHGGAGPRPGRLPGHPRRPGRRLRRERGADQRLRRPPQMLEETGPELAVITAAGPDERQAFFWQWAPAFEPAQAPEALLAPLYRTLPRSFAVSDGEVTETWSGLPPFERWTDGSTEETRSTTP